MQVKINIPEDSEFLASSFTYNRASKICICDLILSYTGLTRVLCHHHTVAATSFSFIHSIISRPEHIFPR